MVPACYICYDLDRFTNKFEFWSQVFYETVITMQFQKSGKIKNHRITKLQNCKIPESQNHRIAES
jgi:hypothetical protein